MTNYFLWKTNHSTIYCLYLAIPYFLLLVLVNWLGFYINKAGKKYPDIEPAGLGTAEDLLGLTALLLSPLLGCLPPNSITAVNSS